MFFWKTNKYKKMTPEQICENMSVLMLDKSFLKYFYNEIINKDNNLSLWSIEKSITLDRNKIIINDFQEKLNSLSDDNKKRLYKIYYKILPETFFRIHFIENPVDLKILKFYIKKMKSLSNGEIFNIFKNYGILTDKSIIRIIKKWNMDVFPMLDENLSNYYYDNNLFKDKEECENKSLNYMAIITSGILNYESVVNKLLENKNIMYKYELLFLNWITHDIIKDPSLYFSSLNNENDFDITTLEYCIDVITKNEIDIFNRDIIFNKLKIFITYIKKEKEKEISDFFIERLLEEFKMLSINQIDFLINYHSKSLPLMKNILDKECNYIFYKKLTSGNKYENLESIKQVISIINKYAGHGNIKSYEDNMNFILYLLSNFDKNGNEVLKTNEKYDIINSMLYENNCNFHALNIVIKDYNLIMKNQCDSIFIEEKIKEYIERIKSHQIKENNIIISSLFLAYYYKKIGEDFFRYSLIELIKNGYHTLETMYDNMKIYGKEIVTELKAIHSEIQSEIIGSEMKNNVEKKRNRL